MKNIFSLMILILLGTSVSMAQQDAQFTQYMFNTISVNPAYAGSRGVLSISALHRSQWIGLDGAPTTQTINLHSPVSERAGVGFSVINDEIGNGTNQDTYLDAIFSYSLPVNELAKLSFGLKAGGHFLNVDFNKLRNFQAGQSTALPPNIDNKFAPNFGTGIYYHSQKFYLGLSVPNILQTEHFDRSGTVGSTSFLAEERMNWYLISGYVFELNNDWKCKPAALLKAVRGAPLQLDMSANFLLRDKFSFGAAYRWSAAISALVGIQLSDQFMLGMAYDREITELGNTAFNDGSFEVFLRYEFKNRYKQVLTPRFF